MDTQFRSSDWLISIGGLLVLIGSQLPWWRIGSSTGLTVSQNGFDFGLTGRVPILIMLVVAILTVVVKTESLPLPTWLVDPYVTAAAVGVATIGIGVRFFWSGYDDDIGDISRGIGLWVAAAGVVVALVGCVMAIRDVRRPAVPDDALADDEDDDDVDDDDDDDDVDDLYEYVVDDDDDDLILPFDAAPPTGDVPAWRPSEPGPPTQRSPRASRRRRTLDTTEAQTERSRRRPAGPPLP